MKLTDRQRNFLCRLSAQGIARQVPVVNERGDRHLAWEVGHVNFEPRGKLVEKIVAAGYALRLSPTVYQSPTIGISGRGRFVADVLAPVEVGEIRPRLRNGKY